MNYINAVAIAVGQTAGSLIDGVVTELRNISALNDSVQFTDSETKRVEQIARAIRAMNDAEDRE